ncbi:hypothetical protein ILYODFUR_025914 [Ilyodon furcidens]|uniref:Uncharacterized protein n=1 Tax=Ilyodon furcidens TaxID=33524 RepID=A0ABV0SRU5_9TELE
MGHSLSETLVAFMVKAVVLHPTNGFNVDRTLSIQDVQRLKQVFIMMFTLHKLTNQAPNIINMSFDLFNNDLNGELFLTLFSRIFEEKISLYLKGH